MLANRHFSSPLLHLLILRRAARTLCGRMFNCPTRGSRDAKATSSLKKGPFAIRSSTRSHSRTRKSVNDVPTNKPSKEGWSKRKYWACVEKGSYKHRSHGNQRLHNHALMRCVIRAAGSLHNETCNEWTNERTVVFGIGNYKKKGKKEMFPLTFFPVAAMITEPKSSQSFFHVSELRHGRGLRNRDQPLSPSAQHPSQYRCASAALWCRLDRINSRARRLREITSSVITVAFSERATMSRPTIKSRMKSLLRFFAGPFSCASTDRRSNSKLCINIVAHASTSPRQRIHRLSRLGVSFGARGTERTRQRQRKEAQRHRGNTASTYVGIDTTGHPSCRRLLARYSGAGASLVAAGA